MKKLFALILALTMLLSLTACGSSSAPAATQEPAPSAAPEATPEPSPEPAEEAAETPAEEPAQEEADPIMGVYDAETYTYINEFLGLGFQMDESWDVFDEEGLAALNGMVSEVLTETEMADALENSGVVQVFYAQAEDGLVTANIVVENLGLLYGAVLDEQAYVELADGQIAPALEATGMTDVTIDVSTASFAGAEHPCIAIHGLYSGIDFYESIVCIKVNRYMAVITTGSFMADVTGDVLAAFYSL